MAALHRLLAYEVESTPRAPLARSTSDARYDRSAASAAVID